MDRVELILFAQHGWADTNRVMTKLAETLIGNDPRAVISAPYLGWWRTWGEFLPLKLQVEAEAIALLHRYPTAQVRIIGHSLGGLIWLEILHDHPELWWRVHSVVLLASSVGGADLGKIFDPLGWLPLIARDLAKNRRTIATRIAQHIPVLAIAGDWDNGSDGTIVHCSTQFLGAHWHCLERVYHAQVRYHPQTIELIQGFWQRPTIAPIPDNYQTRLLRYLYALPLTPAHPRDLKFAQPLRILPENCTLWQWVSPLGVPHWFVTNQETVIFSGFTGWTTRKELEKAVLAVPT